MFTVVIPLYNKEKSILRALDSVYQQTFKDFEVLIINDGSTDHSAEVIETYIDHRTRLINKTNGGVSSARNKGIYEAKYDYIAFLDADDQWEPDFLSVIYNLIQRTPDACLWGGRQKIIYQDGQIKLSSVAGLLPCYCGYIDEYFQLALHSLLYHSSAIAISKPKILQSQIFYDEGLVKGEDLDFYFRIALQYKIAFINIVISSYHMEAENRAMMRYCPLEKRLIGNISRYKMYGDDHLSLNRFISEYILTCWGLLLYENCSQNEIKKIVSLIDLKLLPFYKKLYYILPAFLKKQIYKYIQK